MPKEPFNGPVIEMFHENEDYEDHGVTIGDIRRSPGTRWVLKYDNSPRIMVKDEFSQKVETLGLGGGTSVAEGFPKNWSRGLAVGHKGDR